VRYNYNKRGEERKMKKENISSLVMVYFLVSMAISIVLMAIFYLIKGFEIILRAIECFAVINAILLLSFLMFACIFIILNENKSNEGKENG